MTNMVLLLIYPHIVYLITHGHSLHVHFATCAAHGKVQEQIHGGMEGVVTITMLTIYSFAQVYFVEQFIVKIYAYELFVPIHAPDVKLRCPKLILVGEVCEGFHALIPYTTALVITPTGISKNAGCTIFGIVFHDVHLST